LTALDLGWTGVFDALPSANAATAMPGAPNILLIARIPQFSVITRKPEHRIVAVTATE